MKGMQTHRNFHLFVQEGKAISVPKNNPCKKTASDGY